MEPVGLVFKDEGVDKYGKKRQGEIMLVHVCQTCGEVSTNRVAADDDTSKIIEVFEKSQKLEERLKEKITALGIHLLEEKDRAEIEKQLFGK